MEESVGSYNDHTVPVFVGVDGDDQEFFLEYVNFAGPSLNGSIIFFYFFAYFNN